MFRTNYNNYKTSGYLCPHTGKFFKEDERPIFVQHMSKIKRLHKKLLLSQGVFEQKKQAVRDYRASVKNLTDLEHLICKTLGIPHPGKVFLYYRYFEALPLSHSAPEGVETNWGGFNKEHPTSKLGCFFENDRAVLELTSANIESLKTLGIHYALGTREFMTWALFADDWSFIQAPWVLFLSYHLREGNKNIELLSKELGCSGLRLYENLNKINLNNKILFEDINRYTEKNFNMTFGELCSLCSSGVITEHDVLKNPSLLHPLTTNMVLDLSPDIFEASSFNQK